MLEDHLAFLIDNWPWYVALVIAVLLGAQIERGLGARYRRTGRGRGWRGPRARSRNADFERLVFGNIPRPTFDHADQLREVERATFSSRPLLNKSEARLLRVIEAALVEVAPEWRVMAQVSLGEILASPSELAYRAINSKRVDLLLVNADGDPLHAIEYQGSGHHLGPAATRDAVKKEALRKAGIGYVEVQSGDTPGEVRAMLAKLRKRVSA